MHHRLLLALLVTGIASTLERIFLACYQHRAGPQSSLAAGTLISIADGVKLYSQSDSESSQSVAPLTASVMLALSVAALYFTSNIHAESHIAFGDVLPYVLAIEEASILTILILMSGSENQYMSIGIARVLIVGIIASILVETLLILLFSNGRQLAMESTHVVFSSDLMSASKVNLLLLIIGYLTYMLLVGKIPFDYAESESELIGGISTDIGGFFFSALFVAEFVEGLAFIAGYIIITGYTHWAASFILTAFLVFLLVPRLLHSRSYLHDVRRVAFIVMLWAINGIVAIMW